MCGINGFLNLSGRTIETGDRLVDAMNRATAHRGPDDEGLWSDREAGVYLGSRRLSIQDLSDRGHQPMVSERGVLAYNGEVYNFRELREASSSPATFVSDSDTEVLLAGLDRRGSRYLSRTNGMFGLAYWNRSDRSLLLARDRIGIKPLYYTTEGGVLSFSSEIRALFELPWVSRRLDEEALALYLTFNRVPAPRTLFAGIRKLEPGHVLTATAAGVHTCEPFWTPERRSSEGQNGDELAREVRDELERSVQRRMISDAPVGAFLSGGVDSSAVVELMSRLTSKPVRTYTIGFEEERYDERAFARRIAEGAGADHREKLVTRPELEEFLPRMAEIFDDPLADATSIPIHFLASLARDDGTKVILTGDGADELFCGYRGWASYARREPLFRAMESRWNPLRRLFPLLLSPLGDSSPLREMGGRAARGEQYYWAGAGGLKTAARGAILSSEFLERSVFDVHEHVRGLRDEFEAVSNGADSSSLLDWMSYSGVRDLLPNYYLHRADRLGMANSVELRVPFLDHHLVELALSIPGSHKLVDGEPKAILKKALEGVLSAETLYRPKTGFCVPLREWFGDGMESFVESRLDRLCQETGLFDARGLRKLLRRGAEESGEGVHGLWNVYFLVNWFEHWLF